MTPNTIEERVAVIERVAADLGEDFRALAQVPQAVAVIQDQLRAVRDDVKQLRDEKTSSKATTAALFVAAISAFATLGAAALTLIGTAPS